MTARITTQMMSRNVLADINNAASQLDRTRQKASSGKELTRPSDNPYATARALKLRETVEGTRQHTRNAEDAIGWQDAAESALGAISETVRRVRELLIQASSGTTDAASRKVIATEVGQLIQEVKEHGNASYAGRFVFGGTNTDRPPYPAGAGDAYAGNNRLIAREIGPGVSLAINVPGSRVIGSGAGDGILGALRRIEADLNANNAAALGGRDLAALDTQLDALMVVRAENGAGSNRIESALSRLAEFEETTVRQLSATEDADFAQVMIDLNSQQAAYQAALKSGANIVQSSLMDFLR